MRVLVAPNSSLVNSEVSNNDAHENPAFYLSMKAETLGKILKEKYG